MLDSSGMMFAGATATALEISGIANVVKETGAELLNFDITGFKETSMPNTKRLKKIYLANHILDYDVIISLPKLNTHMLTCYTGAVENFIGVVPIKTRKELH